MTKAKEKPAYYSPIRAEKAKRPPKGAVIIVKVQGYNADFRGTYPVGDPMNIKCEVIGYPDKNEFFSARKFRVKPLEKIEATDGYWTITMDEVVQ